MQVQSYALGQYRVKLDHLIFEPGVRDYDKKNVARLRDIFKTEGCQREIPEHFIPAIIDRSMLDSAWQKCERPSELLLPAGYIVRCLHGKHRVLASKESLPYRDQWWILNLYDQCEFKA